MDWKNKYKKKLSGADEAVKHIKSGDKVVFAHCVSEKSMVQVSFDKTKIN